MQKDLLTSDSFRHAVDSAFNHIILTDVDGKIIYANDATTRITGYSKDEIIGQTPKLWGGIMPKEYYINLWDTIKNKQKPYIGKITNKRKDGTKYHALVVITPIHNDENGELMGFIGTEDDISDLEEAQTEAEILSTSTIDREGRIKELKDELEKVKNQVQELLNKKA